MIKVLVSACLIGTPVRYNGASATRHSAVLDQWKAEGRLVPVCPEVLGGLPVPRPAAEMQGVGGGAAVLMRRADVVDDTGQSVTHQFIRGARAAVRATADSGARVAVLKDNSPSCGTTHVYDGTFQRRRVAGQGVAAAALSQAGVRVFADTEIDAALSYLLELEGKG